MRLDLVTALLVTVAYRCLLVPAVQGPASQRPRHELQLRPGPTLQRPWQPVCSRRCRACRVGAHLPAFRTVSSLVTAHPCLKGVSGPQHCGLLLLLL